MEKDSPTTNRSGEMYKVEGTMEIYEHTIDHLEQDTVYSVSVSAYTKVGLGPAVTKQFRTDLSPGSYHVIVILSLDAIFPECIY